MKRWGIAVLFSIVTSCPTVSVADDNFFNPGRSTGYAFPITTIPFGSSLDSDAAKKKHDAPKMGEKDEGTKRKEKEKAIIDKKIDDAINKAWGRDTTESPDPQK
jgi:hypothetical protein